MKEADLTEDVEEENIFIKSYGYIYLGVNAQNPTWMAGRIQFC
jgi:hypothetical protein